MTTIVAPNLATGEIPGPDARSAALNSEIRHYGRDLNRRVLFVALGLIALLALTVGSIVIGSNGLSVTAALGGILALVPGLQPDWVTPKDVVVVQNLRLPRAVLAIVAGGALSVSGVLLQGLLRNPLVSPFTLGISPAAAFGAALVLIFFGSLGTVPMIFVVLGALISAILCAFFVLGIAATRRMSPIVVILLGVALTQLFEALTHSLQFVADESTLQAIVRWAFGSVNGAEWGHVAAVGLTLLVIAPLVLWKAVELNAIAFAGDDGARSLGVNVDRTRLIISGAAVVLAAVTVAFTGVIGFVSLVGPHIARMIIGADHRLLLPFSAVTGALLVLLADIVGRTILAPVVVPVGLVIAFIGAPVFIHLILSKRHILS